MRVGKISLISRASSSVAESSSFGIKIMLTGATPDSAQINFGGPKLGTK